MDLKQRNLSHVNLKHNIFEASSTPELKSIIRGKIELGQFKYNSIRSSYEMLTASASPLLIGKFALRFLVVPYLL